MAALQNRASPEPAAERPDAAAAVVVVGLVCLLVALCILGAALLMYTHVRESQALSKGVSVSAEGPQAPATSNKHLRRRHLTPDDQPNGRMGASQFADIYDTFESAMNSFDAETVQGILGSVDERQVRETHVLLRSCNWDMDELLQREIDSNGR